MKQHTHKVIKAELVDFDKYVNTETGETLHSELDSKTSLSITKDTGLKVITSKDYSVIDTNAFMVLAQILSDTDLAKVLKMAVVTKTDLNVVYNSNIPHTNDTLQKYLEIKSEAMFIKLVRTLMKAGILYQIKGKIYGEVRVCYMLNPYLGRKRKTFNERVFEVFEQFQVENIKPEDGLMS